MVPKMQERDLAGGADICFCLFSLVLKRFTHRQLTADGCVPANYSEHGGPLGKGNCIFAHLPADVWRKVCKLATPDGLLTPQPALGGDKGL